MTSWPEIIRAFAQAVTVMALVAALFVGLWVVTPN